METNAEHEQDHTEFGELACQTPVGNETRREWTEDDAGDEITHQRRQPEAGGSETEDERERETDGNRREQRGLVMHAWLQSQTPLLGLARRGHGMTTPARRATDPPRSSFGSSTVTNAFASHWSTIRMTAST